MWYNLIMKILLYSDVHGNKDVLERLYNSSDYKTSDLRIFLGDAVMIGPYPNECLEMLFNSGDVFLMGNHDSYCAYGLPVEEYPYFKADKMAHQSYMRNKVKREYQDKLKALPKDYKLEIQGVKFYFAHFTWETDRLVDDDPDVPGASTIKTAKLFDNVDADYIIFGHNHGPSYFDYNGRHFICVGSIGMKAEGYYCVISIDDGKVAVEKKNQPYDTDRLIQDMLTEDYPRARVYAKWINNN